jgi:hypothetical protein
MAVDGTMFRVLVKYPVDLARDFPSSFKRRCVLCELPNVRWKANTGSCGELWPRMWIFRNISRVRGS